MNEEKSSLTRKAAKKGLHKLKHDGHLDTGSTEAPSKIKKSVRTKTYSKSNIKPNIVPA